MAASSKRHEWEAAMKVSNWGHLEMGRWEKIPLPKLFEAIKTTGWFVLFRRGREFKSWRQV